MATDFHGRVNSSDNNNGDSHRLEQELVGGNDRLLNGRGEGSYVWREIYMFKSKCIA